MLKRYAMVVIVEVEDGVNDSKGSAKNVERYLHRLVAENMGSRHDRGRGIPLKVKGSQVGKVLL